MRNIWEIFKQDALRIRTNVIAIIAIVGITVVPCLYAWFNIAASWDPYKNTGNLKVAVASVDEGYDGQLIPIEINVGDQVLSMMRGNTQMDLHHERQGGPWCQIRRLLCGYRHS